LHCLPIPILGYSSPHAGIVKRNNATIRSGQAGKIMQDPERTFSYVPSGQRQHRFDQIGRRRCQNQLLGWATILGFIFLIARYLALFFFFFSQQNTVVFIVVTT
jgi:hypothetical protein